MSLVRIKKFEAHNRKLLDMLKVENITRSFGPTVAVDNVSFEITKGEVVGLLGPNGAGKTTAMRIITNFVPPDSGKVTVGGHLLSKESLRVRELIGYLPEDTPLYEEMGVVDYLGFISEMRGIPKEERNAKINEVIETCKLKKELKKSISELSKGFRQRVGLAATLVHDPELLILDEPTSGLDPKQIIEIRELIKKIGREKPVILSTHILPIVEATCERVLIIDNGKITARGTKEELKKQISGEKSIRVSLRDGKPSTIRESLEDIEGVSDCRRLSTDGDLSVFRVRGEKVNLTEDVYKLAVEKDWIVNELREQEVTLEDVFLKLTSGES